MILEFDTVSGTLQNKHILAAYSKHMGEANLQISNATRGLILRYFYQRDENRLVFEVNDLTGMAVRKIDIPFVPYKSIRLSQNGDYILIGSLHKAFLIDVASDHATVKTFEADKIEWVWGLDLAIQAMHLITGGNDKTLRIWDVNKDILVREISYPIDEFIRHVYVSSNNKWMATSGHSSNKVFLWSMEALEVVFILDAQVGQFNTMQSDNTGSLCVVSSSYGHITVIDTRNMTTLLKLAGEEWEFAESIAFSPDSKKLAVHDIYNQKLHLINIYNQVIEISVDLAL
jgi:WD40 repeat protein